MDDACVALQALIFCSLIAAFHFGGRGRARLEPLGQSFGGNECARSRDAHREQATRVCVLVGLDGLSHLVAHVQAAAC